MTYDFAKYGIYRTETISKSQYGQCMVKIVYGVVRKSYRTVPKILPIS